MPFSAVDVIENISSWDSSIRYSILKAVFSFFLLTAKDYCKVIFPYEAQTDDELTIKEGDIVTLINKVNKGSLLSSKL